MRCPHLCQPAFAAFAVLLLVVTTAGAATDPDGDPAIQIAAGAATDPDGDPAIRISAGGSGDGELRVDELQVYLQQSAAGVRYARLEVTVTNHGPHAVHKHLWRVTGDDFAASSITSGTLAAGEQRTFTQLAFGPDVADLQPGDFVFVELAEADSNRPERCVSRGSQEQCEADAAALQDACNAGCVRAGLFHGGQMHCAPYEVKDQQGTTCTVWSAWCHCSSTPTFTEGLAAGTWAPGHPLFRDLVQQPPRVEMRQLFP